jgi:lactoylglutathione lyase
MGTDYGHIALAVDDLDETFPQLEEQGIQPDREPYRVREARESASSVTRGQCRIELIKRSQD